MKTIKHLRISGRVQGVGYRYYMARAAREYGVTGWVRNRTDGSVEAVICGTPEAIELMIVWARRGPDRAAVTQVEINEGSGEYDNFGEDFGQRPTE